MHDEIQSHFEELLKISYRLTAAREELTKKMKEMRRNYFIGIVRAYP
jgi:hypothetical protein